MKILKYLFIIIVPNILLAQQTWTLQECVNRAIEMNISIKQSKLDYAGSEIEKQGAIGNFLPSFSASTGVRENTGLSFNPTTNQAETETFLSASGSINSGSGVSITGLLY